MHLTDTTLLRTKAYIHGQWIDASNGAIFPVANPATGEVLAQVSSCGAAETRVAIEAAENGQKTWRNVVVKERARLLRRWFDLMMEHQEELAQILTAEQGNPIFSPSSIIKCAPTGKL